MAVSGTDNAAATIWWVRRDLRLADNPALVAAVAAGGPVIPVFVRDATVDAPGAAPRWRLGLGLDAFARRLAERGARLILRAGDPAQVLRDLAAETGARRVVWNRLYDGAAQARDRGVKAALRADGLRVDSFGGHLLFEPWTVETGQGGFYKVYTPFWKAVRDRDPGEPLPAPARLPTPGRWPDSAALADWRLGAGMGRGATVVAPHTCVGEEAAQGRLGAFVAQRIGDYAAWRDFPAEPATSRLSENLTCGEIGPRTVWAAGRRAMEDGKPGAETFLRELIWREFAYHLLYHTPQLETGNWKPEWDAFPWQGDNPAAEAWRRGRTGVPLVDAGMREMYVTGTMHNRARMIVASYLTKHLMTHWKVGADWFAECLIDWDPAANAMGWQWAAGSGPDAAPYFRVFNPGTQADRFDRGGAYRSRFIAEVAREPGPEARAFFDAVPRSWGLSPDDPYPDPVVGLAEGRRRALDAYAARTG